MVASSSRMLRGMEATNGKTFAYVGTYTSAVDGGANGKGIYLVAMDHATGELTQVKLAAETHNPSWLAVDPSGRYLYAANEVTDFHGKSGSVSAYRINRENGDLELLNVVSSEGAAPAHLSMDATGKYVFVADYAGGSIAVLPIQGNGGLGTASDVHHDTGSVGPKIAQDAPKGSFAISGHDAPHAHMIEAAPDNRFVLQTDLGQDRIYVYRFDASAGKLSPAETPFVSVNAGDGPRHFAFHPNKRWMYLLTEEASNVTFFHFDASTGALHAEQTLSALPPHFAGTSFGSEILVSPNGKFLYTANRLHDTISIFSIGSEGRLAWIGESSTMGDYPRHIAFDPSGRFAYACNQRSDAIAVFKVDAETGRLNFTGRYFGVGTPSCIVFLK
ncbi:lactonase family protein [Acidicapsa dinghuensis]|uniref:Lactonase family protein n=2 Tax=Acidicapsa dinghuensis TaxID=2218256 RepID=A0ABW1EDQ8_9BACT|nr:lactonase family protein [Acidicapsa dinghuensis]